MGWEAWATGALLLVMMGTLFTGRFGPDIVLLGALVTLLLMGVVEPGEAVFGFSNTGVITVALLYVVAAGLKETGAMGMLTGRLLGRPKSESGARARMALPVAGMSAFVNNTPIVAMFLPVLSGWAKKHNLAPSRLFLPLSYAAILGGVCTLIGTSTNLVIAALLAAHSADLVEAGRDPAPEFGMFTITAVGLPMAAAGLAFLIFASGWLLPRREAPFEQAEGAREYTAAMRIDRGSPVIGQTIEEAGLRGLPGLFLARIERGEEAIVAVGPAQRLREGDVLVFVGRVESIVDLQKMKGLLPVAEGDESPLGLRQTNRLMEVVISPSSPLVGQSIRESGFRSRYGAVVVGAHRHGGRLRGKLGDIVLRAGDTLLIEAPGGWAEAHADSGAFYLVSEVPDSTPPRHERAWVAIAILAAMMAAITFGWLHTMVAAMAGAGAMVALRCCTGPQARASVDWQVLITIGAAFGIGQGMESSGLAGAIAHYALGWAAQMGPVALLTIVYALTVIFTQLITNNAAAILMFPIAMRAGAEAGLAPLPLAVMIAVGASCGFVTPIGYHTNLMVMGPGGYKWTDYLRLGAPLQVICGVVAILAASMVYGSASG